ncbi:MAG: YhjD/YihY/BrkB family envelope integrity protein [Myxococcota bacterium]
MNVAWALEPGSLESLPRWKSLPLRLLRAGRATIADLMEERLSLWAMSLVYTTLMSIVPLLAVSFSVLKGFGVHTEIQPLLLHYLAPLGDRADEMTTRIMTFVENTRADVLGSAGVALLFYTVFSLTQKIERVFNETWQTSAPRPLGERLARHLSILLVGPVVVFALLGLTASAANSAAARWLMDLDAIGPLLAFGMSLSPYLLVIAAFAVLYKWIPNTHVTTGAAIGGAVFAGIAWETAGLAFASFVGASGRYDAIYSGFALVILFMLWTYASWLILLAGANFAHHLQHGEDVPALDRARARDSEALALRVAGRIARAFRYDERTPTAGQLAHELALPSELVESCLVRLEHEGLVVATDAEPPTWLPRRALESIEVREILDAFRPWPAELDARDGGGDDEPRNGVDALLEALRRAGNDVVADLTLRDLAELAAGKAKAGEAGGRASRAS